MSYNDKAFYGGREFLKNGLDAPLGPIVGINHGRDAPLIVANDRRLGLFHGAIPCRAGDPKGYTDPGVEWLWEASIREISASPKQDAHFLP